MMTLLRRLLADAVLAGAVFAAGPVFVQVAVAQAVAAPARVVAAHDLAARAMPAGSFAPVRASDRFWNDDVTGLAAPSSGGATGSGSFSSARPGTIDEMASAGMRYVHVEPSNCSQPADKPVRSCAVAKAAPRPAILPEAATWAMMILGFGIAGSLLRRALLRSEARFEAKIKRIEADEPVS